MSTKKLNQAVIVIVSVLVLVFGAWGVSIKFWPKFPHVQPLGVLLVVSVGILAGFIELRSFFNKVRTKYQLGRDIYANEALFVIIEQYVIVAIGGVATIHLLLALDNAWLLVVLVAIVVYVNDGAAEIIGRLADRFLRGPARLSPKYSPGKTVIGACGGWIVSVFVGWTLLSLARSFGGTGPYLSAHGARNFAVWVVVTPFIPAVAICGDWVESRLKRKVGVKDSGELTLRSTSRLERMSAKIFGELGGALDKTDSLWPGMFVAWCAFASTAAATPLLS